MIYSRLAVQRALRNRDPGLLQVAFEADVLDRYRGTRQFTIMRTDSAGRVKLEGGWALDFGIARDDQIVHASWIALTLNLPDEELTHWAEHALAEELSENFLRMQLAPGSCFDDGELRTW
jgi:hypothetical protein